jgi:hypothetical protein
MHAAHAFQGGTSSCWTNSARARVVCGLQPRTTPGPIWRAGSEWTRLARRCSPRGKPGGSWRPRSRAAASAHPTMAPTTLRGARDATAGSDAPDACLVCQEPTPGAAALSTQGPGGWPQPRPRRVAPAKAQAGGPSQAASAVGKRRSLHAGWPAAVRAWSSLTCGADRPGGRCIVGKCREGVAQAGDEALVASRAAGADLQPGGVA